MGTDQNEGTRAIYPLGVVSNERKFIPENLTGGEKEAFVARDTLETAQIGNQATLIVTIGYQ